MNQTITLGQSVLQAMRFMADVYKDIWAMLRALDESMEKKDWYPAKKYRNKVSAFLSNALDDPGCWLMPSFYRLYGPQPNSRKAKKVLAICVNLFPREIYDEPMCILLGAKFSGLRDFTDMWENWDSGADTGGSDRVLAMLNNRKGVQELDGDLLHHSLFPEAVSGFAFAVPLCSLNDIQSLESNVVTPLITAADTLTFKPVIADDPQ